MTLNTIIEEEMNRARVLANETIDDYHKEQAHIFTNPALDTFITTAMQRAYEAGVYETIKAGVKEIEGNLVRVHERDWDQANLDEGFNNGIRTAITAITAIQEMGKKENP